MFNEDPKSIDEKEVEKMEDVTCKHCGYKWETNSEKQFVTCPNCLRKTPLTSSEASTENAKE